MSKYLSSDIVCSVSYHRFKLNSFIFKTIDSNGNNLLYTIAKYSNQFYHCKDEFIEKINKSTVFEQKYPILICMYVRDKSAALEDCIVRHGRYKILKIPLFIFLTLSNKSRIVKRIDEATATTTTTDAQSNVLHEQIHAKCKKGQVCFNYDLHRFLVITKDEKILIVKPTGNNNYEVYDTNTKFYEDLSNYRFEDFSLSINY